MRFSQTTLLQIRPFYIKALFFSNLNIFVYKFCFFFFFKLIFILFSLWVLNRSCCELNIDFHHGFFFFFFQLLVAKPDQLIKRRGKLGLIKVKTDLNGATSWIQERLGKDQQVL